MVAPGLIVTATHVLHDHVDAVEANTLSVFCVGNRRRRRDACAPPGDRKRCVERQPPCLSLSTRVRGRERRLNAVL
jgi:hypothetical protein